MAFKLFFEHELGKIIRKIVKNISYICANFIGLCVSLFIFAYCYRILCFNSLHIPSLFSIFTQIENRRFLSI